MPVYSVYLVALCTINLTNGKREKNEKNKYIISVAFCFANFHWINLDRFSIYQNVGTIGWNSSECLWSLLEKIGASWGWDVGWSLALIKLLSPLALKKTMLTENSDNFRLFSQQNYIRHLGTGQTTLQYSLYPKTPILYIQQSDLILLMYKWHIFLLNIS